MKVRCIVLLLGIGVFLHSDNILFSFEEKKHSVIDEIQTLNMSTLAPWEGYCDTDDFSEFLAWALKRRLTPHPADKRRMMFKCFKQHKPYEVMQEAFDSSLALKTTWVNLNLFAGEGEKEKYVANCIDKTVTEVGKISLYSMLAQPTTDVSVLQNRQEVIKRLLENSEKTEDITTLLSELEKAECALLALWNNHQFKHTAKRCFFSLPVLKEFNISEEVLLGRSIFQHGKRVWSVCHQTIAAFVLTCYGLAHATNFIDVPAQLKSWADENKGVLGPILRYFWFIKERWFHVGLSLVGGVYCGLNAVESYKWACDCFFLEEVIHSIMREVSRFIVVGKKSYEFIQQDPVLIKFDEFAGLKKFFEKSVVEDDHLEEFVELCESVTLASEPSMFSHKGKVARAFALLHEVKQKLRPMIAGVARLDVYCSLAKLYRESQSCRVRYSFAQYAIAEKPLIEVKNFWHPLLDKEMVVTNSITLGVNDHRPNIIITGPNAGGKSVLLKSMTLCLWMAQTIGVVPADSLILTPFNTIATYLNVTDDIGAGDSLFMAEVLRAQKLVEEVEKAGKNEFTFVVFDEIFSGTSPVEGEAAAFCVARYLSAFPSSICLIATHFASLAQLESETSTFKNYKVTVDVHEDGKNITYPYTLQEGISDQHVALKILRNKGFSGSMIDGAEKRLTERI